MITENKKKKKKVVGGLPGVTVTYTTGDPFLNAAHFNKDAIVQGDAKADAVAEPVAGAVGADAGASAGPMSASADSGATSGDGCACAEGLNKDQMHASRLNVDVELPSHIHIVDESLIKAAIKKVEPEEEFDVGYVTPVYFYKDLWDKFTLFKCTEMRGWTGEDYIEARVDKDNSLDRIRLAYDQTTKADQLAAEAGATDHSHDGGIHNDRNPIAGEVSDFSAPYTLVNKIIKRKHDHETLLFYPVVGSKPRIIYYVDLKDGQDPIMCTRDDLVDIIYKKVREMHHSEELRQKIADMLALDAKTVSSMKFNKDDRYETRSRFDNSHNVEKPMVRALYLNQIYYLKTKDITLGNEDQAFTGYAESLEEQVPEMWSWLSDEYSNK